MEAILGEPATDPALGTDVPSHEQPAHGSDTALIADDDEDDDDRDISDISPIQPGDATPSFAELKHRANTRIRKLATRQAMSPDQENLHSDAPLANDPLVEGANDRAHNGDLLRDLCNTQAATDQQGSPALNTAEA